MASRCIGMLSKLATTETINCVLKDIIPLMKATQSDIWRQGAIEAIASILFVYMYRYYRNGLVSYRLHLIMY